jgi:2'-5' RNA ligase
VDVVSPEIIILNKWLSQNIGNKPLFEVYTPHITVGYVKKGLGEKLSGCRYFRDVSFDIKELFVSYNMGAYKEKVKLKP